MTLRLACADFAFPLLPHDRVLDLIAALDSRVWTSACSRDARTSGHRASLRRRQVGRELGRQLADRGLQAADVFLQMAPDFVPYAINHPQLRGGEGPRLVRQDTRLRRRLRGATRDDPARCVLRRRAAVGIAGPVLRGTRLARGAGPSWGITFGVEPHVGSIVPSPREAQRLVDCVPGLTLTLDYTHFARKGMPDAVVEPLLAHATHFHVRGRKGRLQTSFDKNTIDYRRIVERDAQVRLRGLDRRRIHLDRLGARQRKRLPVGDDPVSRLPPVGVGVTNGRKYLPAVAARHGLGAVPHKAVKGSTRNAPWDTRANAVLCSGDRGGRVSCSVRVRWRASSDGHCVVNDSWTRSASITAAATELAVVVGEAQRAGNDRPPIRFAWRVAGSCWRTTERIGGTGGASRPISRCSCRTRAGHSRRTTHTGGRFAFGMSSTRFRRGVSRPVVDGIADGRGLVGCRMDRL